MSEPDVDSPFHAGERAIQARLGTREASERLGRHMIRGVVSGEQRRFFAELPLAFVATLGTGGFPEPRLITGAPGFLASPEPEVLVVNLCGGVHATWLATLETGDPVALLGIDFETRRRNRLNGSVLALEPSELTVAVDQSFGNCKRYIVQRGPAWLAAESSAAPSLEPRREGSRLGARAAALVRGADTFFIASSGPPGHPSDRSLDVSHRGGPAGFVHESSDARGSVLTFPDFAGNDFFNTLGNLELEPRAGLLFVDFDSSATLALSGHAEVLMSGAELADYPGAERLVRFRVERGVWRSVWVAD